MERTTIAFVFLCLFAYSFAQTDRVWQSVLPDGLPGNPLIREYSSLTYIPQSSRVFLFSGVTYDGSRTYNVEDAWFLQIETSNATWYRIESQNPPTARAYSVAVATVDYVILYGGRTENVDLLSDVWRFHVGTQVWTRDTFAGNVRAPIRTFSAGVLDDTRLLLFGGYAAELFTTSNDVWAYDITENTWTELIPNGAAGSPPPRQGHTAVYAFDANLGPGFIIFGGYTDKGGFNDAWRYYSNTNKWSIISVNTEIIPEGRFGHTASSADYVNFDGTEVLIFGGEFVGSEGEIYHNDVWSLKVSANNGNWTRLVQDNGTQGPWKRAGHASFAYNKIFYAFAGYGQYVGLYNDLWRLQYPFTA